VTGINGSKKSASNTAISTRLAGRFAPRIVDEINTRAVKSRAKPLCWTFMTGDVMNAAIIELETNSGSM
jgi:hypothetical protein